MNKEIQEKFERWKKIKIIYWIALISGITEEILKRRRRTSLAIGATIAILVTIIIAFSGMYNRESRGSYFRYKDAMRQNIYSGVFWDLR